MNIVVSKKIEEDLTQAAEKAGVSVSEMAERVISDGLAGRRDGAKKGGFDMSDEEWAEFEKTMPVVELSEEAEERLAKSSREAEQGINVSQSFSTVEDAVAYLRRNRKDA